MAAVLQQARAGVGAVARQIGRGIDKVGAALETHPYQEKCESVGIFVFL